MVGEEGEEKKVDGEVILFKLIEIYFHDPAGLSNDVEPRQQAAHRLHVLSSLRLVM